MTLDKMPVGAEALISSIGGNEKTRLKLLDLGFTPRTGVRIRQITLHGDVTRVELRGYELALSKDEVSAVDAVLIKK